MMIPRCLRRPTLSRLCRRRPGFKRWLSKLEDSSDINSSSVKEDPPFQKVLIANRGEIASRVMRTCHSLGIDTVAIYSTFDSKAPFVNEATERICIGSSYLNADAVLTAIEASGAQAVHPGYGFFSENTSFASSMPPDVTWLGPSPEAITQMGCKIRSKELAMKAGVNVVPGHEGQVQTLDHAIEIAKNVIGYPVLLKAAAGGGGKGMRICHNDDDLRQAFDLAQAEALNFFRDDRLLVEKYVEDPHHIEFQLLSGKRPGTQENELDILVFCERECSIQRRHQKILEESPSPLLKEETRLEMVRQVKELVKQVDYTSAGTVEFLVDQDQNFYFLEMNTRLQVEHPVTELVSVGNPDLVKGMLWVGAGLGIPNEFIETMGDKPYYPFQGHAIEARVYAEDPVRGFLPSTGPLIPYQEPCPIDSVNEKLRIDSGVAVGHVVTPHYDPMLSKVIAWNQCRESSLGSLHTAMEQYVIGKSIQHNGRLVMDVLRNPDFVAGKTPTSFLDTQYPNGFQGVTLSLQENLELAAAMASMYASAEEGDCVVRLGGIFGQAFRVSQTEGQVTSVQPLEDSNDNQPEAISIKSIIQDDFIAKVEFEGHERIVQLLDKNVTGTMYVQMLGADVTVMIQSLREYELSWYMKPPPEVDTSDILLSPMPGTLIRFAVSEGDTVEVDQELCVVEAMKMQNIIRSPRGGVVAKLGVEVGSSVRANEVILHFVS